MQNTRPVTELDFDKIKEDLIAYFKTNPTFTDYSFEGSALNGIMDILAYSTHSNAYYANMQHNEGFLDTAQKRSSVVSRAKELGYTPRSAVCSTAFVDVGVTGITSGAAITIPRGTVFTSRNDNGSFQFIVADTVSGNAVGTSRVFDSVRLVNGKRVENTFKVDSLSNIRSVFTIPNKNIDTSTLKVFVRAAAGAVERVEYFISDNIYELNSNSRVFFLQESYDGFFQIYFGSDVIGTQPTDGNYIDIDYITTADYEMANGCRLFGFSGTIGNATGVTVTTTQISFGGSDKEDIASIKFNAVKSNSAKNRAVTENDYGLILRENFDFIKSVAVWGGETNIPPVYGKVFVSVLPVDGYAVSTSVRDDLMMPKIRSSSLLTIIPEFVDPTFTNLEFVTRIKFNPLRTTSTQISVEGAVQTKISDYIDSISNFNTDYLESELVGLIKESDPGIVSVSLAKRASIKMSPLIGVESIHNRTINNPIVPGSIRSTKFRVFYGSEYSVTIKEVPDKNTYITNHDGSLSLIATLGLYTSAGLVREIGTVNMSTGTFNIQFALQSYISSTRYISLSCQTVNDDITVQRNQILNLDPSVEDTKIGLVHNNVVITELYGK